MKQFEYFLWPGLIWTLGLLVIVGSGGEQAAIGTLIIAVGLHAAYMATLTRGGKR